MSETTPLKLIPPYLKPSAVSILHSGWGPIGPFLFTAGPLTGLVQPVTATMRAWEHQFWPVQKTLGLLVLPDRLLLTTAPSPPDCSPAPFLGGPEPWMAYAHAVPFVVEHSIDSLCTITSGRRTLFGPCKVAVV